MERRTVATEAEPAAPLRRRRQPDIFDFLLLDDLGYLPRGTDESEALFTLIAERYEPPRCRRARSEEETAEEQL